MLASTASAVIFPTTNDLGVLTAPGSTPTAVLYRNGVSSGVTVTVTNVSTGLYKAAWTNGAWSHGDVLQLLVTASIDSTSYTAVAWDGEINSSSSGLDAAGVRSAVGLASANLDTQLGAIDDFLDTEVAAIKAKTDQLTFTTANQVDANALSGGGGGGLDAAGVRAAVGLASANLDTQLGAIDDFLDTEVAAIKAKTDQLTFTVANQVDANMLSVDEDAVDAMAAAVGADIRTAAYNLTVDRSFLETGEITVKQRDDYAAADGRAYEMQVEIDGVDFSSATVVAGAGAVEGAPTIVPTASLQNKTVGSCTLRLEFTSAQLTVDAGTYFWDAHIVLAGRRNTVVEGQITVLPKYADAP